MRSEEARGAKVSDKYLVLGILHSEASANRTAIRDATLHLDPHVLRLY